MYITRQSPSLSHFSSLLIMLMISLFLHGCSGKQRVYIPEPVVSEPVVSEPEILPPAEYKPVTGQATALYAKAEDALHSGKYTNSEMLLERALRIEPQNPHYWYTMALVKYRQGQYPQTVQFCLKAGSLAGNQPQLASRNQELLEQARKAIASQ